VGDFFIHPKFNSTQKRKVKSRKEKRKADIKTFSQLRVNLSALCVKQKTSLRKLVTHLTNNIFADCKKKYSNGQ
jgi:hypothetical protein